MPDQISALDSLDCVFELPASITDDKLKQMYEILQTRLRRDLSASMGKEPTTIQVLVAERTAFNYILIKSKDQHPVGSTNGFQHMTAAKEFNAFWLNLAEQLNKMMQAGNNEFRENLIKQIGTALNSAISQVIVDPDAAQAVRVAVKASLSTAGL